MKLWNDNNEPTDPQDICDSCSQAVLQAIGRRKHIERGRHYEGPRQEHLKSPQACDADAKARLAAARNASTSAD